MTPAPIPVSAQRAAELDAAFESWCREIGTSSWKRDDESFVAGAEWERTQAEERFSVERERYRRVLNEVKAALEGTPSAFDLHAVVSYGLATPALESPAPGDEEEAG